MAPDAVLDIASPVGLFTEVLGLVMAIDTGIEDRLLEQLRLETAVHLVADDTLAIGHWRVADLIAEVTGMARLAGGEEIWPHAFFRPSSRGMALGALPFGERRMDGEVLGRG